MPKRRTFSDAPTTVVGCLRHLAFTARVYRSKTDPEPAKAWAEVEIILAKLATEHETQAPAATDAAQG